MAKEQEEKYFFNDFKDNRKSLNLTVDDIVKSTKIQRQYIIAIEKGEFSKLPPVYSRLFLKSYCKITNLDQEKILFEFSKFLKGNKSLSSTNKTPSFIKNKKSLNDLKSNNKLLLSDDSSYFIKRTNLLSFAFALIIIVLSWITIASISKNNYVKYQTKFDNTKLNWDYLNNLTLADSQYVTIEGNLKKNIIRYEILENIKNKILISNEKGIHIENRILRKNDQEEKVFKNDIKFGLLNGKIDLFINNKKLDFIHSDKAIIGDITIEKKKIKILLKYFQ